VLLRHRARLCSRGGYDDFVDGFISLTRDYVVGNPRSRHDDGADGAGARADFIPQARRALGERSISINENGRRQGGSPYLAPGRQMLITR
jgi:hypothetical protein